MAKQKQLSPKYQVWIDARKRHKLSHAHIQMARELGMDPKRFGKDRPENVRSVEQMVKDKKKKQLERKQRKLTAKESSQQRFGVGPRQHTVFIRKGANRRPCGALKYPI